MCQESTRPEKLSWPSGSCDRPAPPTGRSRINVGIGILPTYKRWPKVNTARLMEVFIRSRPSWRQHRDISLPTSEQLMGWRLPCAFACGGVGGGSRASRGFGYQRRSRSSRQSRCTCSDAGSQGRIGPLENSPLKSTALAQCWCGARNSGSSTARPGTRRARESFDAGRGVACSTKPHSEARYVIRSRPSSSSARRLAPVTRPQHPAPAFLRRAAPGSGRRSG